MDNAQILELVTPFTSSLPFPVWLSIDISDDRAFTVGGFTFGLHVDDADYKSQYMYRTAAMRRRLDKLWSRAQVYEPQHWNKSTEPDCFEWTWVQVDRFSKVVMLVSTTSCRIELTFHLP